MSATTAEPHDDDVRSGPRGAAPVRGRGLGGRLVEQVRTHRRLGLLLLLLVLPLLAAMAGPVISGWLPYRLGDLAACSRPGPEQVEVIIDVSESVIGPGGADTRGRSFDEARLLQGALGETACSPGDRFGAVIFADRSVQIGPVMTTEDQDLTEVLRRPDTAAVGSGTNLSGALGTTASRSVAHGTPSSCCRICRSPTRTSVRQALDTLDADVYLVALGNHAGFADSRFDAVIEIELARRGDVADALVTVINHARTAKDTP